MSFTTAYEKWLSHGTEFDPQNNLTDLHVLGKQNQRNFLKKMSISYASPSDVGHWISHSHTGQNVSLTLGMDTWLQCTVWS